MVSAVARQLQTYFNLVNKIFLRLILSQFIHKFWKANKTNL